MRLIFFVVSVLSVFVRTFISRLLSKPKLIAAVFPRPGIPKI